jgi:hypothetical protein
MIWEEKRIVMRLPNYRITKCWLPETGFSYFLDRVIKEGDHVSLSNIVNGAYDYCLKELDRQRELDKLEDVLRKNK